MRLGLMTGYSGARIELPMEMILEADRLGYYAVWTAEAYGSDSISPLAWIGAKTENIHLGTAIMQMPARTPAMTAMTAMTLDQLSGGRMLLGLGLSGPQVVEGWHGQAYGKPLGKTREYVKILRTILAREERLIHEGRHYQVPYNGDDATGLGKPLKSILHGRPEMPIYLAAIGPKNVQLTAEIADGWLPVYFSPTYYDVTYKEHVEAGFAKAGDKSLDNFDIAPNVMVALGDDIEACRNSVKPFLALYVGGMGAKGKNFYYDLVCRYGYEEAADQIQELYLAGKKGEAAQCVPDALVDEVALCGPKERIKERLEMWKQSPITTMNISTFSVEAVRVMAELVLGADSSDGRSTTVVMGTEQNSPDRSASKPVSKPANKSANKEEENTMSEQVTAAKIFEVMGARVAANPDIVHEVGAVFQFHLTDPDSNWVCDIKNGSGDVRQGETDAADCTITISEDNFLKLTQGKLNPQMAFMTGKIKAKGNIMLATKLQKLM